MKQTLLSIILILLPLMASETDGVEIDGIYYNLYISDGNKTASVTYNRSVNYSGDIVIPESVEYNGSTFSITSIGYNAFASCSGLTSVTIGNSVNYIGDYAFYGCSGLTSVMIPVSDLSAFCNNKIVGLVKKLLTSLLH